MLVAAVALVAAAVAAASTSSKQATTISFWNQMNDQETVTAKSLITQPLAHRPVR